MDQDGVSKKNAPTPVVLSPFLLYELAVTNPLPLARFLHAVHGKNPRILREDFSGSGSLAKGWADHFGRAIAVDQDAHPLSFSQGIKDLTTIAAEVHSCRARADIIAATNFPLGYLHTRNALLAYLRHARACLKPRGVFAADIYGGGDAFAPGKTTRKLTGPNGEAVLYVWEQAAAFPQSGRVHNAIHFKVTPKRSTRATWFRNAFTYDWRLWSIPELRDAFAEAGFRTVEVYDRIGDALDADGRLYVKPLKDGEPMDDPYVVYVVGRR